VGLVLILSLAVPQVAAAESEAALRARLQALKRRAATAGAQYSHAYWALDETDVRLSRTNKRITKAKKALAKANKRLRRHANAIYRREDLDTLGFLVGASSFDEFVTRMDYVSRIGKADAAAIVEVKLLKRQLYGERKRLTAQRAVRARNAAQLRRQRNRLLASLNSTESQYRRVKAQLDAERSGGRLPSGIAAAPGPNGMVFPVAGNNYYSNTWGASRSGGRRRHQGTDIMARRGTPCVAILSGRVRVSNNGLGGRCIWLTADNGWQFYYAHLDRWVVRSGRVRAGQVIGTVGSTGNAAGGSPHLHLQVHPGGGGPVNPYPYLRSME
jgi:murein DD-endopeptidase MepM/ murein hydrolase activator NlpD